MTRVLLLGAGGMLATDLLASPPEGVEVIPLRRGDLDITDAHAVTEALAHHRPSWVVNAAAYTRVDDAERDYATALAVNGTAVGVLGQVCADCDARMVHFGSDYVFSGTSRRPYRETDPPDPVNAYGASKLAGERELAASGAKAVVLRTQWLYGLSGKSFPRTMWTRALQGLPTRVVEDQFGRPTDTRDVARVTWELIALDAEGLYHLSSGGPEATWFDIAARVFEAAGARELLTACRTVDYPTPARRPAYSVLDAGRLAAEHGIALPAWEESIDRFVADLRTAAS